MFSGGGGVQVVCRGRVREEEEEADALTVRVSKARSSGLTRAHCLLETEAERQRGSSSTAA